MSKKVETVSAFDHPKAIVINQARQEFLNNLLPNLKKPGLVTALDVGCGVGYFSGYLKVRGLL